MSNEIQLDHNGLPFLTQFSEDGFIDCVFMIHNLQHKNNTYQFDLLASYEGHQIGFSVEMVDKVGPGWDTKMQLIPEHVYRHGVIFKSLGERSNRLLNTMNSLYGLSNSSQAMVAQESFTAIALHQGNIDLSKEPIKLKLFGKDNGTESAEDYNESFFNINLPIGFVFWNEKDNDYRIPLIRSLTAQS
jgi:hypothetical protein